MVVNLHTGASGSATDTKFLYDTAHGGMLGLYEVFVFTRRPLWFMIFGGVFDRHPDLKVVVTENGVQWLPSLIRDMESFFDTHGGAPVRSYLKMRPRDYFEQHVWLGGSLMKRYEAEMRHEIGIDKLMWGADYPHLEGAAPVHRETLRYIFGGLPEDDLRRILGGNAVDAVGLRRRAAPGGGRPRRPDGGGPGAAAVALAEIEDTFSWSLARPVPLADAGRVARRDAPSSAAPGAMSLARSRYPRSTDSRPSRSAWRRCHAPLARSASSAATPRAIDRRVGQRQARSSWPAPPGRGRPRAGTSSAPSTPSCMSAGTGSGSRTSSHRWHRPPSAASGPSCRVVSPTSGR